MSKNHHTALLLAIETAGGQVPLARICGCSKQNINAQVRRKRGLPPRFAVKVEKALGLSRHLTRPDIFGPIEDVPNNG